MGWLTNDSKYSEELNNLFILHQIKHQVENGDSASIYVTILLESSMCAHVHVDFNYCYSELRTGGGVHCQWYTVKRQKGGHRGLGQWEDEKASGGVFLKERWVSVSEESWVSVLEERWVSVLEVRWWSVLEERLGSD